MRSSASITLLLIGILLSCTRSPISSRAIVNFGDINAQSLGNVRVLILNVSGPNMQRIVYQWSCPNEECTTANLPSQIEIEVPSGSQRLFQVIVAGENSSNNTIQFNYDDEQLDVSGSSMPLALVPTPLASGGAKFDFGGRYSADGTNFHSGWIDMIYQPPGKPPMVIESHYMFAGWFRLFGIDGAGFSYVKRENGAALFSNVSLSSLDGSIIPGRYAKFVRPPYYYDGDQNTAGVQCTPSSQEKSVLGFFGPSGYTSGTAIEYLNSPPTHSFTTMWESNNCSTTAYQWDPGGGAAKARPLDAFAAGSSTPCSGIEFTTCLIYDYKGIQNGNEYEFRFHGPNKLFFDGSNYVFVQIQFGDYDADSTPDDMKVTHHMLPGLDLSGSVISGFDYYYDSNMASTLDRDESVLCTELESKGFSKMPQHDFVDSTPSYQADIINIPAAGPSGSYMQLYVCPYQIVAGSKQYYDSYKTSWSQLNP